LENLRIMGLIPSTRDVLQFNFGIEQEALNTTNSPIPEVSGQALRQSRGFGTSRRQWYL
jgi:hypothetical protein